MNTQDNGDSLLETQEHTHGLSIEGYKAKNLLDDHEGNSSATLDTEPGRMLRQKLDIYSFQGKKWKTDMVKHTYLIQR